MSGICGIFNFDGGMVDRKEVESMRDIMVHRGPDDSGIYLSGGIGLGHRRLPVIDIEGSRQPLSNENGSVWVVNNGEIYNFQTLAKDLVSKGHVFKTNGGTEVLVHLYEEYGAELVKYLRGMFAFAIWDKKRQKIVVARDRLGIKPFYYYANHNNFYFASEIKALLAVKMIPRQLDETGLQRYLKYRYVYGQRTLFKDIYELPPGYYMEVTENLINKTQYWNISFSPKNSMNFPKQSDQLYEKLKDAVGMRMKGDVPVGSFLSGGIDSSTVTALMAKHAPGRLKTFTIGFAPEDLTEFKYAKKMSEKLKSVHYEYSVTSEGFYSLLQKLVWHNDEPLMFPASLPLYLLAKHSKKDAAVMLAGEGADELFAGYDSNIKAYRLNQMKGIMPDVISKYWSKIKSGKYKTILNKMQMDEWHFIETFFTAFQDKEIRDIYPFSDDVYSDNEFLMEMELGIDNIEGTFLDRFLAFQMKTYLAALLMKQDKMCMAASVETRNPFLDESVVELACNLPDNAKIREWAGKYILKKTCERFLPDHIIYRKKTGFPVPFEKWFEVPGNSFIALLKDDEIKRNTFLNYEFIEKTITDFQNKKEKSGRKLWMLLNLEIWRREFLQ